MCSIGGAVGACHTGICDPTGCGNGRVDANEACDDGNTIFGDGCSGDCRSLEACGNGIVDVAVGETCDCGVDTTAMPATCRYANSDSLEAECSTSCELRYCGNEILDRLEQCDGSDIGTATCSDYGYYAGTLGCLGVCRYDTSSCIGRCGDATVDPVYGEFCDGAPPENNCLELGYDAGVLGCSSTCTPDVDRCESFGWKLIDTVAPRSLWARGRDVLMIASDASSAWMAIGGLRDMAPAGTYRVATGVPGGDAYAVGDTTIAVWNGAEWSTMPTGWTGATPVAAWASATLGLYVVLANGVVWRYHANSWTEQGLTQVAGITGTADVVYAWTTGEVKSSTGGAWSSVALPAHGGTITGFAAGIEARWLGVNGTTIYHQPTARAWGVPQGVGSFTQMVTTTSGDLLLGPQLRRFFTDARLTDGLTLPGTVARLATSPFDEGIVAVTNAATYRLRTGSWLRNYFIYDNQYLYDATSFHVGSAGGKAIHAGDIAWYAPPGSDFYDLAYWQPFYFSDFTETLDGTLVFATSEPGESGIWFYDGDGNPSLVADGPVERLRNARDGAIVATGDGILISGGVPTVTSSWTMYPVPGYDLNIAHQRLDGSFVALAQRKADSMHVVLTIDTTATVAEVAGTERASTSPWRDLWLAEDDTIYAVNASTLWIGAPGMAATTVEFPGAVLESVGGTSRNDVFVGGGRSAFSTFPGLAHFDGTQWTLVRPATDSRVLFLHVTDTLISYVFGREQMSLQRVIPW